MPSAPSVLNVHTPTSSFAIVHSLTQDSLVSLYDKLSRKAHTDYHGERVAPGWLKYAYNDAIWNLDDESDYTIFTWRETQLAEAHSDTSLQIPGQSSSSAPTHPTPTLHLHNPKNPLPVPPAYRNPAYYLFRPSPVHYPHHKPASLLSKKSSKSVRSKKSTVEDDGIPSFKKDFEKFHSENGVRTVMGSIGPVPNVRMLLKSGYRHVYISRKFAVEHGFIPSDATPGHYGYSGLVNIGTWPITLYPSASHLAATQAHPNVRAHPSRSPSPASTRLSTAGPPTILGNGLKGTTHKKKTPQHKKASEHGGSGGSGLKETLITVYLSEEPHFDVVLGRSFFEKRQIKTNSIDPTDVVCMDTGEKIECELVILKDGRGEIVTVT